MAYIQISIIAKPEEADMFAGGLNQLDALSVTLEDAQDTAIFEVHPHEKPLWEQVKINALFEDTVSPRDLIHTLKKILNRSEPINYRIEKIADQDWVRLTQQYFKPQCYADKLWVIPSWYDEAPEDMEVVFIDPGLAFGTGTHPTTNLCLEWLAQHPPHQKTVIDYGCGSGILALAAARLGGCPVYATDHDEQALIATQNNLELNGDLQDRLIIAYPDELPVFKADLIIANILTNTLIGLQSVFLDYLKKTGTLVLSGILEYEIQRITEVYQQHFDLKDIQTKDQWALITLMPKTDS